MAQVSGAGPRLSGSGGATAPAVASSYAPLAIVARHLDAEQQRWFLWLPVLFGSGIALYFALPTEPWTSTALLPLAAALPLYLLSRRRGGTLVTAAVLTVACGLAAAKLRTEAVRAPVLQRQLTQVEVTGFVELIEPRAGSGQRLTIRVATMSALEPAQWPVRVRIRASIDNPDLKPGDAIRLKANLSPPPWPSLPGDFDFARAAWFQGLGAVGFANAMATKIDIDGAEPSLALQIKAMIERVRQAIGRRVLAALPGETGAIANALITGERGGISEQTNQAFRDSGLFHILSISGLHMVIMAGAVFGLIRMTLAAIPAIALRYPIKKWAAAGAMAGALAYLLISGAAFATVRSYIMISIMFLAVLLDRPAMALRNVALAALVILLLWPESLFDAGFQMSFAAVVALVSVYEWLRTRYEREPDGARRGPIRNTLLFLGGIVTSTLVASLAVAPFGIYHFHNTQQFAILANLLAIPICNLLVMPASLAALITMPLGIEAGALWAMGVGIEIIVWCAEKVAALPGAVGRVPAIPTRAFVLIVVGGLWLTLWATRWRLLGLGVIAVGLLLAPGALRPDILIGRDAGVVAVRGEDGLLSIFAGRGSRFEMARWLEHDGDARTPAEAAKARAFQCDAQGCTARVQGLVVALPANAATLGDACPDAAILIVKGPRPRGCPPQRLVISTRDIEQRGAHALFIKGRRVQIQTVADGRGRRPWSTHPADDAAEP